MTRRTCIAERPITQALPDRVVHARPGQVVEFTAAEASILDPLYWASPTRQTIREVRAAVGGDPVLAAAALADELASEKPRRGLVEWLEGLIPEHHDTTADQADDPKEA